MVAVNQEANTDPLFHITPGLLFEELEEEEEERNKQKKKTLKKIDRKIEK